MKTPKVPKKFLFHYQTQPPWTFLFLFSLFKNKAVIILRSALAFNFRDSIALHKCFLLHFRLVLFFSLIKQELLSFLENGNSSIQWSMEKKIAKKHSQHFPVTHHYILKREGAIFKFSNIYIYFFALRTMAVWISRNGEV